MTYLFETEEHAQLRTNVRRFAEKYIAPHAHAWEEAEEFPRELYKTAADAEPIEQREGGWIPQTGLRSQPHRLAAVVAKQVAVRAPKRNGSGAHRHSVPNPQQGL